MTEVDPNHRPTAAEAVLLFANLRKDYSWLSLSTRLRKVGELLPLAIAATGYEFARKMYRGI